jgi:hypothetical protein
MKPLVWAGLLALFGVGVLIPVAIVYEETQLDEGVSALKAEDYITTLDKLRPLALLGDSDAQYILGKMYAFGWGVVKDNLISDELQPSEFSTLAGVW